MVFDKKIHKGLHNQLHIMFHKRFHNQLHSMFHKRLHNQFHMMFHKYLDNQFHRLVHKCLHEQLHRMFHKRFTLIDMIFDKNLHSLSHYSLRNLSFARVSGMCFHNIFHKKLHILLHNQSRRTIHISDR